MTHKTEEGKTYAHPSAMNSITKYLYATDKVNKEMITDRTENNLSMPQEK